MATSLPTISQAATVLVDSTSRHVCSLSIWLFTKRSSLLSLSCISVTEEVDDERHEESDRQCNYSISHPWNYGLF